MEKQVIKIKPNQYTVQVGDKVYIFDKGIQAPNDRVAIIPDDKDAKTSGGLIIPDSAKGKVTTGTIASIGHSVEEPKLVIGAKVMYTKYAGQDVEHEKVGYVVMREHEIQLVLGKLAGHVVLEEGKELEVVTIDIEAMVAEVQELVKPLAEAPLQTPKEVTTDIGSYTLEKPNEEGLYHKWGCYKKGDPLEYVDEIDTATKYSKGMVPTELSTHKLIPVEYSNGEWIISNNSTKVVLGRYIVTLESPSLKTLQAIADRGNNTSPVELDYVPKEGLYVYGVEGIGIGAMAEVYPFLTDIDIDTGKATLTKPKDITQLLLNKSEADDIGSEVLNDTRVGVDLANGSEELTTSTTIKDGEIQEVSIVDEDGRAFYNKVYDIIISGAIPNVLQKTNPASDRLDDKPFPMFRYVHGMDTVNKLEQAQLFTVSKTSEPIQGLVTKLREGFKLVELTIVKGSVEKVQTHLAGSKEWFDKVDEVSKDIAEHDNRA